MENNANYQTRCTVDMMHAIAKKLFLIIVLLQFHGTIAKSQIDRMNKFDGQSESNGPGGMPLSPFSPVIGKSSPWLAATYYYNPPRRQNLEAETISEDLYEDGCKAADGREGTCYDAMKCIEMDGVPMGRCAPQNSVCCIFERSCGGSSNQHVTYFRNPGYPVLYNKEEMCKMRVERKDASICQIRLDFEIFDVARPKDGNCSQDMLVISGQNENNLIPKICGANTGHHYYIDVDESGMVSIQVMMVSSYRRIFDIKVTQVICNSQLTAPAHCLQYHHGTSGYIKSFNYDETKLGQGYPNDMDYTICLRKEPGFCSVSYELAPESGGLATFGVGALPASPLPSGPVLAECPDDFLVIGGIRVCSGRLTGGVPTRANSRTGNTTLTPTAITSSGLITDSTPGPFYVRFVSNIYNNARGFHLLYKQNPCK